MNKSYKDFINSYENSNIKNDRIFENYCINSTNKDVCDALKQKSSEIIKTFDKLSKNERRILLAGKVQSGKTLAFLSCINESFNNGYEIIIVLTSLDKMLQKQTDERLKQAFKISDGESISNISLYRISDLVSKKNKPIPKLVSEIKQGKKIIITALKVPTQLNNTLSLFITSVLKEKKVLIIDDESDLASNTMSSQEQESKALSLIHSIINRIDYCSYLSVTATPYVQLVAWSKHKLIPKKVFTIKPGDGYMGLESFFENDNLIEIMDDEYNNSEKFQESDLFWEIILRYWITVSSLIATKILDENITSSMLFHINVKVSNHEKLIRYINERISNYRRTLENDENDVSYRKLYEKIIELKNDKHMSHLKWESNSDKEIFNVIKILISRGTDVISVNGLDNSSNVRKLKNNNCNILIGSKLLERGITIENLLFTVFTNVPLKDCTIDTTLQRARWFGYRENIKEYIKLYTTENIKQKFIDIMKTNAEMWKKLCDCEESGEDFDSISGEIITYGKNLMPTAKVATIKDDSKNKYFNRDYTDYSESSDKFLKEIFKALDESSHTIDVGNKKFNVIEFDGIKEFYKEFKINDQIMQELLDIDEDIFADIKKLNKKIIVSLMQNDGESRERSIELESFVLSQGRGNNYEGDDNWLKIKGQFDGYFVLQLHDIVFTEKNVINGEKAYFLSLLKPIESEIQKHRTDKNKYE